MVSVQRRIFHLYPVWPANHPNALGTPQASHRRWDEFLPPTYYFGWIYDSHVCTRTVCMCMIRKNYQLDTHYICIFIYVYNSYTFLCSLFAQFLFLFFFSRFLSLFVLLLMATLTNAHNNYICIYAWKLPFVLTQTHMHYELLQHKYLYTHIYVDIKYNKMNDDIYLYFVCIFNV